MILTKIIHGELSRRIPHDGYSSWSDGVIENVPSFSGDLFTILKSSKKVWSYSKTFNVPEYPRVFSIEIKISFEEDSYGSIKSYLHFLPVSDFFSEDEIYAMCSSDSLNKKDSGDDEWDSLADFSSVNYIGGIGIGTHYSEDSIYSHNESVIRNKDTPLKKPDAVSCLSSFFSILNTSSKTLRDECLSFVEDLFSIREDVFKAYYYCTFN